MIDVCDADTKQPSNKQSQQPAKTAITNSTAERESREREQREREREQREEQKT